jgi:type I restriction-modification system DNA methylase subunit
MPVPEVITKLIERFDLHRTNLISPRTEYNETKLRQDYLDHFFIALGWDVYNTQGWTEQAREVSLEQTIKIQGTTDFIDYSFKIGRDLKFIAEAKAPRVRIKDNNHAAYQVRRYAWNAKQSLCFLTNFDEFAVYDCTKKPSSSDAASVARIEYFTFKDIPAKWDWIVSVFSKEAVYRGSFDRFAESTKGKKGTANVDDEFLNEIENWRDVLAKNIAIRNTSLSVEELNYSVQTIIDRIIFLRICEDRGLEKPETLKCLLEMEDVYLHLCEMFQRADTKYNSGIFYFQKESDREEPDTLTLSLKIDDKTLKGILKRLYYPESPYEFSVIPPAILGQVYEQFLGKIIRLTEGHQARVEYKPEVKKAGGVFYTPQYIVEYIVQHTVEELIKGKTPREISKIRILDPACGSGSFLIVAFQSLLDWHLEWYKRNLVPLLNLKTPISDVKVQALLPEPIPKRKKFALSVELPIYNTGYSDKIDLLQRTRSDWTLSTTEKKRILLNNIFGVDIDHQAVEVTKLSLLLKVLEGESEENIDKQLKLCDERALPSLHQNIKCGNSLIGTDILTPQIPTYEIKRINPFDWEREFNDVMKAGGFDAVIGNPPYVDIKGLPTLDVEYIFSTYKTANNRINLFSSFIELSLKLQLKKHFRFSMIIPTAFLTQDTYKELRRQILEKYCVVGIVRLPNESFGTLIGDVKVDTAIIVIGQNTQGCNPTEIIGYVGYNRISKIESGNAQVHEFIDSKKWEKNTDYIWSINTGDIDDRIIEKIEVNSLVLDKCVEFCLGLTPYDKYKGHTESQIKNQIFHSNHQKDSTFKNLLAGNDVQRYFVQWNGTKWISYGSWLGAPREQRFFVEKRILVKQIIDWTTKRIWAAITDEELYNTQNAFNLLPKSGWTLEYILGILNSKLMTYYHKKKFLDEFKMRFQKILIKDCRRFPIRTINFSDPVDKASHDRIVALVTQMLDLNKRLRDARLEQDKTMLTRQIEATDMMIDKMVYDLYGLTEEEITLVEGAER